MPPFDWPGALLQWSWHPLPLALALAAAGWYARRVRSLRRSGAGWPTSRTLWWCAGLGTYLLVTVGPVGAYSPVLFSARAVQVITLLMITPQLLAHALPLTLARDTATPAHRAWCSRVLHSGPARVITHPFVGVGLLLGVPVALYFTGWYEAGLRQHSWDEVTQLVLLVVGAHYFWTRLQRDPVPRLYPQMVTVVLTFAEVALDIVVPLVLLSTDTLVAAEYYLALDGAGGVSPEADQMSGGGIIWVVGDLALIPFLVLSLRQLGRRDAAQAVEVDSELDAQERTVTGEESLDPAATTAPWWEQDAAVARHFRWEDDDTGR